MRTTRRARRRESAAAVDGLNRAVDKLFHTTLVYLHEPVAL